MFRPLLAAALLTFASSACDDPPPLRPTPVMPTGGFGGQSPQTGGAGQGGQGGTPTGGGGTAIAPVYLGVRANASSSSPPALAELRAFAAGVRLMAIEVPFDAVDAAALADQLDSYAEQQLRAVVTLLVVDGRAAHRPPGLEATPWDDPAMKAALTDALTAIEGAGANVEAVAIGWQVDAYLAAVPAEAAALSELLEHAIQQAPEKRRGIGLGHPLAVPTDLVELGTVSVRSYLPGLGTGSVPVGTMAMDLDAMAAGAGARPVLLQGVGFPSSAEVTASEETQLQAIDALVSALVPRRARFPWIVVHQLHDLDEAACAELADGQGMDPDGPWAAHACSTGLRTAADEPKEAWDGFLSAAAQFATP